LRGIFLKADTNVEPQLPSQAERYGRKEMKPSIKSKIVVLAAAIVLVVIVIAIVVGVGGLNAKKKAPAPSLPEVEVVQVEQKDVPISGEWIGTLAGMVDADVKAQVQGYLLTKDYTEGSFVRKGQLLFQIDPRPFEAALAQAKGGQAQAEGQLAQANSGFLQAKAQLAQSEANQGKAQLDVNRYTPLASAKAITQEEMDNAVQANLAAKAQTEASRAGVQTAHAQIDAARAALEATRAVVKTAQLNLGFTKIVSPIDGVVGIAAAQVGDLVNPSSNALTTVSSVDPIKVYFTVSEQEYLNYAKANPTLASQQATASHLQLDLVLADGNTYPHKGKFYVADRQVNPQTGSLRLAGIFPNPGNTLRPGQYGRVRAVTNLRPGALLVPQRAVTEMQGMYQVAVVDSDNTIEIRAVNVGERTDSMWIIDQGLKPGERVVAEGTQRVRPGVVVNPKPFVAPSPELGHPVPEQGAPLPAPKQPLPAQGRPSPAQGRPSPRPVQ
jgi:membrane fusion protein (multidrug efflux system)